MRVKAFRPWIETRIYEETFPGENHKLKHIIKKPSTNVMLQLTEAGQTGVHPGLPAVPPVVQSPVQSERMFRASSQERRRELHWADVQDTTM